VRSEKPEAEEFAEQYGVPVEAARDYLARMAALDGDEQRFLAEIIGSQVGPVVELGAGAGEFTGELLARYLKPGQRLYALERLETIAQKLRETIRDDRLEVLVSDSRRVPLPDGAAALVISRVALHDFVSDDGDIAAALADCVRVLAPGGTFLVYDKIADGFGAVERESAEGRMERINVQLAALEGKRCWGLHRTADYVGLLERLGLRDVRQRLLPRPDRPGYVADLKRRLDQARPGYAKRWGDGVHAVLDSFLAEADGIPNRALPLAMVWGTKPGC
jgi:SAM-dependent methyltransferase